MRWEDLKESFLSMSYEGRLDLVKFIREDRRVSKKAIQKKKKRQQSARDKFVKQFNKLSPEDKEELLKDMENVV